MAKQCIRPTCEVGLFPLDDDLGWDGLDHVRASLGGWRTAVLQATTFHHHRREGQREGRWRYWAGEGQASYRMGYRPSYLLARMAYRAAFEPAALMLVYGYASSMLRRESLLASTDVRRSIRDAQRLRELPNRIREAIGHPQRAL